MRKAMPGEDHYGVRIFPKRGNIMFMRPVVSIEMERLLEVGLAYLEKKQPRTALLECSEGRRYPHSPAQFFNLKIGPHPSWMRWLQFLPPQDQPATRVPCGKQRGSSATSSSSKSSRFPGNWKNCWKFALSSALKRGRCDPYVQGLAEPPGPRAKLSEVGLRLCFLASHLSPGAGPGCCCFKFCSSC